MGSTVNIMTVQVNDSDEPTRVYFDGQRQQWEPGEGQDVPRVEIHGGGLIHTFTWRNMIGTGVMDKLDIDEPPVIKVNTTTKLTGDQVNKLIDLLDEIVEPHVRSELR